MVNKRTTFNEGVLAVAVSIAICLILYVALVSTLPVTLLMLALGLCLIIVGERNKSIEKVYEVMENQKAKAFIVVMVFVLILPLFVSGNSYIMHIAIMAGIYSIIALGLNFQLGSAGMVNFAPAAFYGAGAYTSAILAVKYGVSPWIGMIFAIIMASLLGFIFGYPALKTRGYYLSLVTIAFQVIFTLMIINTDWVGGPNGIPGIPGYQIFGYSFRKPLEIFTVKLSYQTNYFYLVFLLVGLAAIVASRLYNSRIGLAWNAIEQDEIVASTQGINLTKIKLLAFSLGAAFAGVAGALYAHYISFIGNEDFDFSKSLVLICMVILGGMDNVLGVILGAIMLTIMDEKLRDFADYRMLMYAIILIIILLVRPQGLLPKRNRKYETGDGLDEKINIKAVLGGK
ncbi:hypothetical protein MHFGQ_21920 [Moorella humiferrea]|uniref:High-affinity branched-chain amino acid transport system permease protein LivH n=2 Tax=Neomoorella humiferrea TaxID=676965 RepID=A0A2T0ALS2_9FIRM|nr:High-affinity branched-chain amino acid transport system permease protein LivH [Moorella humiferrea]